MSKFTVTLVCITAMLIAAMKYGAPLAEKYFDAQILRIIVQLQKPAHTQKSDQIDL